MRARHGCKLLAEAAVLIWLATTGMGCQSTERISTRGSLASDGAPSSPSSLFGKLFHRNNATSDNVSTTAGWRVAQHEAEPSKNVIASNGWRPILRAPEAANAVVAASGWQSNSSPGDLRSRIISAPTASAAPQAALAIDTPPTAEPPVLPPPRTLAVEAAPETPIFIPPQHPATKGLAPAELNKVLLPPYVIEPPDILLIEVVGDVFKDIQPIRGSHLVRPDGTVSLGVYGSVRVAGLTLEQAKAAVIQYLNNLDSKQLKAKLTEPLTLQQVNVDVIAYNSKAYYIVTDGAGYGEQVLRAPYTGNETVLDALSLINGLPPVASKTKIWLARRVPGPGGHYNNILPVDWVAITQGGAAGTNYQIFPGDRLYVKSQGIIRFDNNLGKILAPIERLLGTTLLGSETVNSIRNRNNNVGGIP